MIAVPPAEELSEYYRTYLKHFSPGEDLLHLLKDQCERTQQFLSRIPPEKESYAYANGKWMLKEVVGHVCDAERIFSYRALRISRGDKTPMNGFEENDYAAASNYRSRSLKNIAEELYVVRKSSIALFDNLDAEMYDLKGTANNTTVSVHGLLFFIVAHERHHLGVISERYLL